MVAARSRSGARGPWRDEAGLVLNVYKEVSWTSHHAVDRVRGILGLRRVGHAGTLDPLASGVLVVGVGRATRLLSYLTDLPKTYRGTIRLGVRTTTGDLGGPVVEEATPPEPTRDEVSGVAQTFVGECRQVPPMVSAVKQGGQRLYRLARRGIEVERAARTVHIERFEIEDVVSPRIDFEVRCSKGTYVRTLAEDLAAALGTIGIVECLTRTAIGRFDIDSAVRLISPPGSTPDGLRASAIPLSQALAHLPAVRVEARAVERLRRGGAPSRSDLRIPGAAPAPSGPVRLLGSDDELLAVGRLELLPGPADQPVAEATVLRLETVL